MTTEEFKARLSREQNKFYEQKGLIPQTLFVGKDGMKKVWKLIGTDEFPTIPISSCCYDESSIKEQLKKMICINEIRFDNEKVQNFAFATQDESLFFDI